MTNDQALQATEQQDLVVTRVFDAPIEEVWQAWSEPEYVMQWWGPTGFTSPSARMDVREGGTSLVCMRAPQAYGGQDQYSTWHYRRIVPLERIDYIHNLADQNGNQVAPAQRGMPTDFPQDQLHTVSFKALGPDKTELTITEHHWSVGQMMEMSRLGLEQCLDKMAAIFAR